MALTMVLVSVIPQHRMAELSTELVGSHQTYEPTNRPPVLPNFTLLTRTVMQSSGIMNVLIGSILERLHLFKSTVVDRVVIKVFRNIS